MAYINWIDIENGEGGGSARTKINEFNNAVTTYYKTGVISDTKEAEGSEQIINILELTLDEYEALPSPNPSTVYFVSKSNYNRIYIGTELIANLGTEGSIPVITMLGSNPVEHEINTPYFDAGATAYDEEDGDITDDIYTEGTVDETTPGEYNITYKVIDSQGNHAVPANRKITVVDASITEYNPIYNLATDLYDTQGYMWIENSSQVKDPNSPYGHAKLTDAGGNRYIPSNYTKDGTVELAPDNIMDTNTILTNTQAIYSTYNFDGTDYLLQVIEQLGDGTVNVYEGNVSTPIELVQSGVTWSPPIDSYKITENPPITRTLP